jgi:micrococcal nuclease
VPTLVPQLPREMRAPVASASCPLPPEPELIGRCWVVDGDTIVIDKVHIRLAGIDAPELDHPFGKQAMWALVKLCKGQTIRACIKPEMSYDRLVAQCFLPDGRDLAAEMVSIGLAIDWPKFSGGRYRHLEPEGVRKKLWRASLRQSGVMWPEEVGSRVSTLPGRTVPAARPLPVVVRNGEVRYALPRRKNPQWQWLIVPGLLLFLVGCALVGSNADRNATAHISRPGPSIPSTTAPAYGSYLVTAEVLNVRERPSSKAAVILRLERGARITPTQKSGSWHGLDLGDGRTGWVYGDFLRRVRD